MLTLAEKDLVEANPPMEVGNGLIPTFPQVQLMVTVTGVPCVQPVTEEGTVVSVYPLFCKPVMVS